MDIDNQQILEIIKNNLSSEDIKRSFIYWDKRILKQGEEIKIGTQTVKVPFESTMVFVDLAPHANWAHPCLYLLIDVKTHHIQTIQASFPPYLGEFPQTYTILLRFGEKPPHGRYFKIFD